MKALPRGPNGSIPLRLRPGEGLLLAVGLACDADAAPTPAATHTIPLDGPWTVRPLCRVVADRAGLRREPMDTPPVVGPLRPFAHLFGEDFSGEATYACDVEIPPPLRGRRCRLSLGHIEYAATIEVNGRPIGTLLWPPWDIDIPPTHPRIACTSRSASPTPRPTR